MALPLNVLCIYTYSVVGKDRQKFFETLVVADLHQLPVGQGTLSVFTNEQGGIIDDTIIMQQEKCLYVVSNAACAIKDLAHIGKHLVAFQNQGGDVDLEIIDDHSLIAIQGPSAAKALEQLVGQDLNDFGFMHGKFMDVAGVPCHVARSGYTGEDGFEVIIIIMMMVDKRNGGLWKLRACFPPSFLCRHLISFTSLKSFWPIQMLKWPALVPVTV